MRELLERARRERVFSAAAWSVGTLDGPVNRGFLGTRSWDGPPVTEDALWDLASVTKPIVGLAVLALVERGELGLDDPVAARLPAYRGGDKAAITVRQLLTHTSGLPGRTPLWREHRTRDALLEALRTRPLPAAPGSRAEYSSQGFILLGLIAEAATGRSLDALVAELVCGPAGMTETRFGAERARAVATEHCAWRGCVVAGQVHDENAVVLGEIAGHAGLFGTLADLERLGRVLVGGGPPLLEPGTLKQMATCHTEGLGPRRGLAWQLVDPGSPMATALGPNAYGHTGFTGTSLWVDPDTGRYFVLLTNRVHPTREGTGIERVRRDFHARAVLVES
ncbi:serine hydrolase domain-containing protein [Amycolatopsis anabasis]|uniref:serine hydrolase domain-containing protein n=1 Tax=Amycolatopsis anabasis TaxID=1840409 RepID=UPI00131E3F81|nr:serine hydrolase domain-containing protein [Amycolatopsis anabasis]